MLHSGDIIKSPYNRIHQPILSLTALPPNRPYYLGSTLPILCVKLKACSVVGPSFKMNDPIIIWHFLVKFVEYVRIGNPCFFQNHKRLPQLLVINTSTHLFFLVILFLHFFP